MNTNIFGIVFAPHHERYLYEFIFSGIEVGK